MFKTNINQEQQQQQQQQFILLLTGNIRLHNYRSE